MSYMMTTLILTGSAATFMIGFLLGDRRGVKQANAMLDANWRELMKSIRDDKTGFPSDADEDDTAPRTLH
ncbi:MAG: hypothetical protein EOQ50_05320 [Mesorhizobium sp.]|uniref:hypothetical protein n=1 Tax=Mesorhizobium sp. TaxID=1871066 RepID=UPI000FE60BEA|nr:hypothetical protein [Mesorhizobium sp.]RWB77478.1 MAG: hypothetical protein EOQ50_05320 [Mesorhizobium sp.]